MNLREEFKSFWKFWEFPLWISMSSYESFLRVCWNNFRIQLKNSKMLKICKEFFIISEKNKEIAVSCIERNEGTPKCDRYYWKVQWKSPKTLNWSCFIGIIITADFFVTYLLWLPIFYFWFLLSKPVPGSFIWLKITNSSFTLPWSNLNHILFCRNSTKLPALPTLLKHCNIILRSWRTCN